MVDCLGEEYMIKHNPEIEILLKNQSAENSNRGTDGVTKRNLQRFKRVQ